MNRAQRREWRRDIRRRKTHRRPATSQPTNGAPPVMTTTPPATGPEHYREAEHLLEVAAGCDWQSHDSNDSEFARTCIAAASAHAALSAVAFQALAVATDREAFQQWRDIAGHRPVPTITNDVP